MISVHSIMVVGLRWIAVVLLSILVIGIVVWASNTDLMYYVVGLMLVVVIGVMFLNDCVKYDEHKNLTKKDS